MMNAPANVDTEYDFIVVGAGAGGGPLAANLARAKFKVLLLEAGGDPVTGGRPYGYHDSAAGSPTEAEKPHEYNYFVPALHPRATRDETFRWDYFVKHYSALDRQGTDYDSKYVEEDGDKVGIWYPRAGALGGCTAHNAMITVSPHNRDWDELAKELDDPSWSSARMRAYFERVKGWLGVTMADPTLALPDLQLLRLIASAAVEALLEETSDPLGLVARLLDIAENRLDREGEPLRQAIARVKQVVDAVQAILKSAGLSLAPVKPQVADLLGAPLAQLYQLIAHDLDPNEGWAQQTHDEGIFSIPLATDGVRRNGTRDYLLRTAQASEYRDYLTIRSHALATRVLLDAGNTAIGVEYLKGAHLYAADPLSRQAVPEATETVHARREVILAGGTFSTPQLLMLSGIGPEDELKRLDIACRVPLSGVGKNLQDRYEVGVVSEMAGDFSLIAGCTFETPQTGREDDDPCFVRWRDQHTGVYTSNGAVISIVRKSDKARAAGADPDLFIFGLPGFFKGYFPGYADVIESAQNHFTWAILKAHTVNHQGTVTLKSADPRARPEINFSYFDEGSPGWEDDLQAVVDGVQFARRMMERTGRARRTELLPGVDLNDAARVAEFVQREAWGHHACGTCKIGPDNDPDAVLDKDFRVRGVKNLRVVDASVFPRIPGFFIVTPIYMISEKASEVIITAAKAQDVNA